MPVFIDDPDAFEKLVMVEGEEYRKLRTIPAFGDCSFDAFFAEWNKCWSAMSVEQKKYYREHEDGDWGISVDGNGAIYGLGGWNRYSVRLSGEIVFLRWLERSGEDLVRAREVGFRIFPDSTELEKEDVERAAENKRFREWRQNRKKED